MTVTIRLTAEEEARLELLSQRTGRTKSFYVREAIRAHLEDLEDTYAADEAVRAYEDSGRKRRPLGEGRAANDAGGR
jgi:RHH-type rel operon transcriptional repressor/antitoxin RelB